MKKEAAAFSFSVLALGIMLSFWGMSVIRSAYANEIHTVQNLVGKVIAEYAEAENSFLEALGDMERKDAGAGADILSRYGYDENEKIRENASYKRDAEFLLGVLSMFCALSILCMYVLARVDAKRKKRQEEKILAILEDCLSGSYHFIDHRESLDALENPFFADALLKLGKALRLKSERLEEEHDNTKQLVTDISHQLRMPVSALKVCFPLYEEAEDELEKEEFYARCRLQMDKLEMLVASLVNISHLETHMIRLKQTAVLLTTILTESVNSVYSKALKKQISIEVLSGENPWEPDSDTMDGLGGLRLSLDLRWTVEAIGNVLDNAIKYSPDGSSIQMRVQKLVNYVRIEIEDQGAGVPKEEQNQIFKRFYRGCSDIVKKEEGTGVGLYLSRKILEEEGGSVFVRSAKAQGSIFVIQLPV